MSIPADTRVVVPDARDAGRAGLRSVRGFFSLLLSDTKARVGASLLFLIILVAILAPVIAQHDPRATNLPPLSPPSRAYPLGTTSYGQDVLSQLIWGARPAVLIALVAGLLVTLIAIAVGVPAAYYGGRVDHGLSLMTDVFLVLPALPLMIVIAAYVPHRGVGLIILVVVLTGWAFGARLLRSQALSVGQRNYIEAARARGERPYYIVAFEVLPPMIPLIGATFLASALYSVLAAAGLEFLGLGDTNAISWGTMLYWAQNDEAVTIGAPLWAIAPGACIGLLGASLVLLNNAFDEIGNPALRGRKKSPRRRSKKRSG